MIIALGADAAGLQLKDRIRLHLNPKHEIIDFGTDGTEKTTHYPVYANRVAKAVASGDAQFGILICGTGIGMAIGANKVSGVRAATASEEYSVRAMRQHNDANVLCLGARVIGAELALDLVDVFLNTKALSGRHANRVEMIRKIENNTFEEADL